MIKEKPIFRLTVKIAAHIFLFWVPAYIVALMAAIYSVASLVDDVKNYVWILTLLIVIIGCCLALAFWTFERMRPLIEISNISAKSKIVFKAILYFLPWIMFVTTLCLPSILGLTR